jgi:preprotein translocase subunit SecE
LVRAPVSKTGCWGFESLQACHSLRSLRRPDRNYIFQRLVKFIKEVRNELKRVSWPSRDEIRGSTTVVIVIVLVLAVFIGLVDRALSFLVSIVFG